LSLAYAPFVATGVLRVVQLNAGSLIEPGWEDRRLEVVAWIERLEPDVVCLQEVWEDGRTENTACWVADRLGPDRWSLAFGGSPFGVETWPDESMRFGSAVLSRWPIDSSTYHRLPVGADPAPLARDVPWELLHVHTAGLDVFSTHLAAAPDDGRHRIRQVVAIDELIRAARGDADVIVAFGVRREAMPAILCGDFNAEPDSDEIRFLCGSTGLDGRWTSYQDAWRVAGSGPGHTLDWRMNAIAADMNVPRRRIDYVFVGDCFQRAGSAGRVLTAELAFDRPLTGVSASDHAGLVVDIVWPQRPADD
jgi:endonuclease/exonuclease/phosphatase family metal-dependent hydrolase